MPERRPHGVIFGATGGRTGPSHQPPAIAGRRHAAPADLVKLTHSGLITDEFETACRRWLASATHGTGCRSRARSAKYGELWPNQ